MLWPLSQKEGEYDYVVRKLVQHGVRRDQPLATSCSNTALHLAVRHPSTLNILLSERKIYPDLEVKNGVGQTPLCKAVCEGNYDSAKLLLEKQAAPEPVVRGKRPMDCAIHNKDEQMVRFLWDHGASIKSVGNRCQQRVVKATSPGEVEKLLNSWKQNNNPS